MVRKKTAAKKNKGAQQPTESSAGPQNSNGRSIAGGRSNLITNLGSDVDEGKPTNDIQPEKEKGIYTMV